MYASSDRPFVTLTDAYFTSPCVIIVRADASLMQGLGELTNETIAVEKDYIVGLELRKNYPHLRTVDYPGTCEALTAVATKSVQPQGKVAVASYRINRQAMGNLKVAAPANDFDQRLRFGVRSDWPELVDILNAGLLSMTLADHDAIRNRWFAVKVEQVMDSGQIWTIVFRVTAVVLLVGAAVTVWNLRLKRVDRCGLMDLCMEDRSLAVALLIALAADGNGRPFHLDGPNTHYHGSGGDVLDEVHAVAFAPDGQQFAAALHDGGVRLWEAPRRGD